MQTTNVRLSNLGTVNKNMVSIETPKGNVDLWFSYETCVAFSAPQIGLVVRQNDWSTTTGKLLNEIQPDKDARVSGEVFEKKLAKLFK